MARDRRAGLGWNSDMFRVRTQPGRRKKLSAKAYKKRRVASAQAVIHRLGTRYDKYMLEQLVEQGLTLSQAKKIARRDN